MVRLIDDLLDVGRITSDRFALQQSVVDLAGVVAAAIETARPLIKEHVHDLIVELPPAPILIQADAARLSQVLANILTNAAKYTPAGGRIELAADAKPDGLTIRVRDNGIGIPADMLTSIFDLFVRLEDGGGGLGIGLALARQLVHLHGGRIHASSDGPGRGSEFAISLPESIYAAPAAAVPMEPTHEAKRRPLRVLVVDDNSDAADMMAVMLGRWGHDARSAYEGLSALALASTFHPEVVLLDLGLPGMDGYEVAKGLRQQPWAGDVTIFAVTGRGQEEDRQRSYANGFQEHIVKPLVPDQLKSLLAKITS
jgi:CheY-like chemotaxis protein